MPERIQRRRTKGWRMPEGARYVGRGSAWGNPFKIGETHWFAIDGNPHVFVATDRADATALFREYVMGDPENRRQVREELAGKDLACWCPLDQPCHADVLLKIANN